MIKISPDWTVKRLPGGGYVGISRIDNTTWVGVDAVTRIGAIAAGLEIKTIPCRRGEFRAVRAAKLIELVKRTPALKRLLGDFESELKRFVTQNGAKL